MENDGENNNVDESSFLNPLEPEEFRRQGHMVIDFIADYYRNIEQYPVRSRVEPGYLGTRIPGSAPNHPEPIEAILRDVGDHIIPGLTHWQSPAHFAYFPSSGSTAGFLGEMLSAGFNVVGFNWMSSPAATELEMIVVNWLGQMLDLPNDFLFSGKGSSGGGGVLQGTTCEAILCTLTAARERTLSRIGRDKLDKLVVYASDQSHCAVQKAAKIAGIHPSNFRTIRTTRSAGFALSPEELLSAMESDEAAGLVPAFLCATVGTTSSTAVDPVGALCAAAGDHGAWVHVDAAYAGSACVCPEFRRFIDGVEVADSFSLNAHKWLLTTLDCCCLWVKDRNALTRALTTSPEYMRNEATDSRRVVDYKDWQIVLSRRFRAMKLWLVLRTYGAANIRGFLRRHVSMAQRFESHVAEDARFEVVVPRNFATVCFRLLPTPRRPSLAHAAEAKEERQENGSTYEGCGEEEANEMNKRLLESINGSGRLYMTHAVIGGLYVIRFAVGATLTEDRHVSMAWEVVREHASDLLSASPTLDGKLIRG